MKKPLFSIIGLGLFFLGIFALLSGKPATGKSLTAETFTYEPPKGYVCYRADSPITIDGKLDDAAWQAAPWTDLFRDIEGERKPWPRHQTRVKMLWDDQNLYIAAELEEPHVWGTLKDHDSIIFIDNDFEVFIDPDGDNHVYGELEINALNTTWDLLLTKPYRDGGRALHAWEILGLRTAVHVDGTLNDPRDTDKGWTVEIAWPWNGLRELTSSACPPKDGDQWRINFSRVEWEHEVVDGKYRKVANKKEDNWVWSPQGAIDMHRPERWGYLQFSKEKAGSVAFVADPSGPARQALHQVYYAQRDYRARKGVWAERPDQLRLGNLSHSSFYGLHMHSSPHGFEAGLWYSDKGKPKQISIEADSRVRRD